MKKNLTWKKLIIMAIIAGVYTAIVNLIPFLKDTSFSDIAVTVEVWILLALIIVLNTNKPLEAALKCFVFFLISQPLVYLIESFFLGFGIFSYYKHWFIMTILTFPLAYITWYIKKENVLSMIIISLISSLLAILGIDYFTKLISNFPHHLLTTIYCFALAILLPFVLLKNKKLDLLSIIIDVIIVVVYLFFTSSSSYEVTDVYEIDKAGTWNCDYNENIDVQDNIIYVTFKDKKDRRFYINCTNGKEKTKVKVIYKGGIINFE